MSDERIPGAIGARPASVATPPCVARLPYVSAGPLPDAAEMARFDAQGVASGCSAETLMNRAGEGMARRIQERFHAEVRGSAVVLCGPGNNGGDGYVVARCLLERGFRPSVISLAGVTRSELCERERSRFLTQGGVEISVAEAILSEARAALRGATLVVDALLGTGQRDAPRGGIATIIEVVLARLRDRGAARVPVIALDTPTGIDATTGAVFDLAVPATLTLTVEAEKLGLSQYPARQWCGEIEIVPIGIDCSGAFFHRIDSYSLRPLIKRAPDSHKGSYGHTLVIAGSREMPGAGLLASWGALRAGSGLVTRCEFAGALHGSPELLLLDATTSRGVLTSDALAVISKGLLRATAVVVGCGLGRDPETELAVGEVLRLTARSGTPVVLDADGLYHLASLARDTPTAHTIMTPHPGEMAHLLGIEVESVQRDRPGAARRAFDRFGGVIVLKGAQTIVCDGTAGGVNYTGNPWMASGGSGDVLAGVIGALVGARRGIGADVPVRELASFGVMVHGLAGDLVAARRRAPVLATDLIDALPEAWEYLASCADGRPDAE